MNSAETAAEGHASKPGASKPGRRNRVRFVLRWVSTLAMLALAFWLVDVDRALAVLATSDHGLMLWGLVVSVVGSIAVPAFVTHRALAIDRIRMSIARLIAINFSVRFYVIVLPRAASVAIRWRRYGGGRFSADALALMLFERMVQLAALMVLSLVALTVDRGIVGPLWLPLWLTCLAGTAASLAALLPFVSPRFQRLMLGLAERLPQRLSARAVRFVESASAFSRLRRSDSAIMAFWSLLAAFLFVVSSWFAAWAMGLDISLNSLVWIRSLVFILTLVPITVGGVGVRELGFVGMLGLLGVPAPTALAFSAANFSFQLVHAAIGALLELWRVIRPEAMSRPEVQPC